MPTKPKRLKQSQCRWCDYRAWGKDYAEVDEKMGAHILENHENEFRKWYNLPEAEGGPREKVTYQEVRSKISVRPCPYCGFMPAVKEDGLYGELTVFCPSCEQLEVKLNTRLPCDPEDIVNEWNEIARRLEDQFFENMARKSMEAAGHMRDW